MFNFIRCLLFVIPAIAPVFAVGDDLGKVTVNVNSKTIPVRVSANTAELNGLAQTAFNSHGRYRLTGSGFTYDIRFSSAGPDQVRVDIAKPSGESVASQTVSGTSNRNALLKAADVAVEKTNGRGLKGFFASKLVFISKVTGHAEVYTSDLFFGEARRVTTDRVIAIFPRWSPDGRKVIYTSYLHGAPDIFMMDLERNQRTTFASFEGANLGAHFSPDGRHVVMVLTPRGTSQVFVGDPQGRGLSPLTHSDSNKASPCYSPDGSQIVFAQDPGPQLYVMSSSGGFPQRIYTGLGKYCAEPDWSRADPNKIAFTIYVGGRFQVAVYDRSKNKAEQVSAAPFDGSQPCWLSDGRHLIYTASSATASHLCILDTETGKSTIISTPSFGQALQGNVWSPRD